MQHFRRALWLNSLLLFTLLYFHIEEGQNWYGTSGVTSIPTNFMTRLFAALGLFAVILVLLAPAIVWVTTVPLSFVKYLFARKEN